MYKTVACVLFILCGLSVFSQQNNKGNIVLHDGWKMQSSMSVSAAGNEISRPSFKPVAWYAVSVPTTIIAGLLRNKHYDFDPFYARNLERIAGPEFDKTWWFRKEFSIPAAKKGRNVRLILQGINYRANIWLNGALIADSNHVIGPYRIFEFDITPEIKYEAPNVLAIEVARPFNPNRRGGDLAIDYADWIHYPADYNGGIVNDVEIGYCDKISVQHPLVSTTFDLPSLATAHLEVDAELINYSDKAENAVLSGKINDDISFQMDVHLQAGESKNLSFDPRDYPQLNIKNPRIWWPWQYGRPELNRIKLEVIRNGHPGSSVTENFGIRQVTSEMIDTASREFIINGKPIMLRGAAWAPDIFQRRSAERQEQEIRLVRDMNMNLIRSEGKLEDDHFYELCDQYGLLVMTGWMCCGAWQYPELWDSVKRNVAMESDKSVMYWLRNKACIIAWLNGSDLAPKDTTVEIDYLKTESELKWPNPILATATAEVSKVSGRSGVKMNGPYDWVPPIYWETDSNKRGGAWSFATEISPGPSIPPMESLLKFIPADSLSIHNSLWLYHCGTMNFGTTNTFNQALEARYGTSSSIRDFVARAQAQNYEGHRAMMEAYGLNKYHTATGVDQWMLSNPWPSLIWHTYDYYLYPAGTYFGMKKSMEPLHVQYSYKSKEVIINNSQLNPQTGLTVNATVYNPDGSRKYQHTASTSVEADNIRRCFTIPEIDGLDSLYFLRLEMKDRHLKTISLNWYWLSKNEDELDWKKSTWYYTPQTDFVHYQGLQNLPLTQIQVAYTTEKNGAQTTQHVRMTNTGKSVAFFVHLRLLKKKGGDDILPVIFDDNYLLLAPGETRDVNIHYRDKDAGTGIPYLLTATWNLDLSGSKTEKNSGFGREY
ncbi:MAG: glycoside hydrolase family 2 protein [Bacteroidota bacterium]|nr:glycoside hydrolase family 2 protein [Bacteroidota bacterium]